MADINLLPEELRKSEKKEQERLAKHSRAFDIQLNQPVLAGNKEIEPMPKESLWRKIFGYPQGAQKNPAFNMPKREAGSPLGLNPSKNGRHEKNPIEIKQKGSGWFSFLGKPQSLVTSMPKENILSRSIQQVSQPQIRRLPELDQKMTNKEESNLLNKKAKNVSGGHYKARLNDSWWSVLKSLFVPVRHQSEKLHLANADNYPPKAQPAKGAGPILEKSAVSSIATEHKKSETVPLVIKKPVVDDKGGAAQGIKIRAAKQPKPSDNAYNLVEKNGYKHLLNVNLIPGDAASRTSGGFDNQVLPFVIAIILPIFAISASWFLIYLGQSQLSQSLKQKQSILDAKIKEIGDYEIKLSKNNDIASRILSIKKLNQEKIAWSNFFDLLEKYTLDGVYYNSLNADTSGQLLLPGIADSYETVAKQLSALNNASDFVKEAKISNIQTYSEGKSGATGVSFQLRLILADHIFVKKDQ